MTDILQNLSSPLSALKGGVSGLTCPPVIFPVKPCLPVFLLWLAGAALRFPDGHLWIREALLQVTGQLLHPTKKPASSGEHFSPGPSQQLTEVIQVPDAGA